MAEQHKEHDKEIPIEIDHQPCKAIKASMTGAELRSLAKPAISDEYDLYREVPGHGDDDKIEDAMTVELKPGMHFYSVLRQINPGANNAAS